jgi:hypothetical protein
MKNRTPASPSWGAFLSAQARACGVWRGSDATDGYHVRQAPDPKSGQTLSPVSDQPPNPDRKPCPLNLLAAAYPRLLSTSRPFSRASEVGWIRERCTGMATAVAILRVDNHVHLAAIGQGPCGRPWHHAWIGSRPTYASDWTRPNHPSHPELHRYL